MAAARLPPQTAAVAADPNDPAAGGTLPPDDGAEAAAPAPAAAEPAPPERPRPKKRPHSERLYGKGKKGVKHGR